MNYRQGDIFLKKIDKLSAGIKLIETNVLALGEITGHKHKLVAEKNTDFRVYQNEDGLIYLEVLNPIMLYHGTEAHIEQQLRGLELDLEKLDLHEQHKILPGAYEVPTERDYTPEGWRRVED